MVTRSRIYTFSVSVALALMLGALVIMATSPVAAVVSGDFEYQPIDSTHAEITAYHGLSTDVVVPAEIDGIPVTSIGESAFEGNSSITSVTIPDGVINIGESAFQDCISLTSITFLGSVAPTSVGESWVENADTSILGHAYAASNFPVPGYPFNGLMMGDVIPVAPDAPTGLIAVAGNTNVTLNWTAPVNYGSSPIDYYVIYQDGVALTINPSELTVIIDGLTNGQSYTFTVAAHNSVGEGTQSDVVSSTPYTVPNVPTGLTAVAGNAQVTLNWTVPTFNGGSSIIRYNVYRSTSETSGYALVNSPLGITYVDTGLTPGQTYWYEVSAVNAAGEGAMTAPISSIPYTVPNAPTGLTALAGNAQVTLNWTAPANDGGKAIDYYVIYQNGSALTGHPNGLTTTITGLTNGHSYSFTVTAHNPAGEGAQSGSVSSTPYTVPNAPTGLTAVAGNTQVSLNWTAPAVIGGRAIDYYTIYQGGVALTGHPTGLTAIITGLTNGQSYSFTVSAHNLAGNGPNSTTVAATPVLVINTLNLVITSPSNGSFNNTGNVLIKWTVTDSSSSVTKMEVSSDGTTWITVTGSIFSYTGLRDGPYTIHVRATDAAANIKTTSVTFTVDTVAPSVSITSPSSGAYVNTQNVTVSWTSTDATSGVAKIELSADGTNWFGENGTSGSLSIQDGSRTLYLRVTDRAGNVNTTMVTFKVDTVAPTVITRSPTGSAASMMTTVNVTFSEAVNRSASSISINGVDGNVVWNQNTISFMPSSALRGRTAYNVTVNARDLAGNVMSSAWTFSTANVGKISGIVHGHDGNVLVNAIVRLIGHSTAAQTEMGYLSLDVSTVPTSTQVTTTDTNGAYAFYDVGIGNYTVEVTEPGYGTQSTDVAMTMDAVIGGGLTVDQVISPSNLSDGSVMILAIVGLVAAILILVYAVRRRKVPSTVPVLTEKKNGAPAKVNTEDERTEPQTKQNPPEKMKERQPDPQVKKNGQGKTKDRTSNSKGNKKGQQRKR